ncbi:MAG: LTA synthase family protein [Rhodospirillales bacterium]|nr:LTA synthase family protein [Rhodospirillales bacterium]
MLSFLTPRYRFPALAILIYLTAASIERLALIGMAYKDNSGRLGELLLALPTGLLADAAMACLLGLPFFFMLHHGQGFLQKRWVSALASVMLLALLWNLFFSNVAALIFWEEFSSRFNGIAVNYLLFPREVIGNIQQSFNLPLLLPPVFVVTLGAYWLLRNRLKDAIADGGRASHLRFYAVFIPVLVVSGFTVYAAPITVGENREANEIANNSYYSFLRAAWTNDAEYDGFYPTMDEAKAVALTRQMVAQDNTRFLTPEGTRSLLRHVDNGDNPNKLNVVLVINESFGATYVDNLDNTRGEIITPNLTRLSKDGLWFTNFYATGVRTVRGLEAILTSFSPIPGISTARRPGSEGMNSMPYLMKDKGYQTAFLYGGRAVFDNMGHYWSTIGFDTVWDQADIADIGFDTIWGAADEYIYDEALKRIDTMSGAEEPFFLSVLSISNHRPYTYPEGRIDKDPADKRKENAATYADWSFGRFIEMARKRPWFDNTVFVFVADHGPRLSGQAQVPVDRYRIPLLIYAPKQIQPQQIDTLGSQIDFLPTLMGLLGQSFDSPFFGVDLRRVAEGQGRVIMSHNYAIGFGQKGHVVSIDPTGQSRGYTMPPGDDPLIPVDTPDPETRAKAIAITQTAHRMFYSGQYLWKNRNQAVGN